MAAATILREKCRINRRSQYEFNATYSGSSIRVEEYLQWMWIVEIPVLIHIRDPNLVYVDHGGVHRVLDPGPIPAVRRRLPPDHTAWRRGNPAARTFRLSRHDVHP